MKNKKLVILSHTEHYIDNGVIKGWGPTINEINYLSAYWEEVCHIACLHSKKMPPSSLPYLSKNITFVAIPPFGGKTIAEKILSIFSIPKIIFRTIKNLKGASEVQLRLPTSLGIIMLPLFSFILPRKYTLWVKYAGNWEQKSPPLSYGFQRWWLKKNFAKCNVTINGFWKNQPNHCYSFENPCLTHDDIEKGKQISNQKVFKEPFVFSFVGRLETPKGVDRILEAFKNIPPEKIAEIHFIGDGDKTEFYKEKAKFIGDKVYFYGFLNKIEVHEILKKSHFFLLPSTASEGFPKVIAEAACYGAIPIVSNVSSIPHYITTENGFLWDINSNAKFEEILLNAVLEQETILKNKSKSVLEVAAKFTFDNYYKKLKNQIFKKSN